MPVEVPGSSEGLGRSAAFWVTSAAWRPWTGNEHGLRLARQGRHGNGHCGDSLGLGGTELEHRESRVGSADLAVFDRWARLVR
jgi:hypothetical protein